MKERASTKEKKDYNQGRKRQGIMEEKARIESKKHQGPRQRKSKGQGNERARNKGKKRQGLSLRNIKDQEKERPRTKRKKEFLSNSLFSDKVGFISKGEGDAWHSFA